MHAFLTSSRHALRQRLEAQGLPRWLQSPIPGGTLQFKPQWTRNDPKGHCSMRMSEATADFLPLAEVLTEIAFEVAHKGLITFS